MAGIRTPDLPLKTVIGEFLGNTDSGTGMQTVRATAASVAAQLAVATGRAKKTWAALSILSGSFAGQRAEVYGDGGTHTDPVAGGTVANAGVYGWSATPAGWEWLSPLDIAGIDARLTAEIADRLADDATETAARLSADTTEATTRQTKDDDLQSQVSALGGSLIADGSWNASTNSPALASGVGTQGHYRIVSTAGTTSLDGISSWSVGDWALFSGGAWKRIPAMNTTNKLAAVLANNQIMVDFATTGLETNGPAFRGVYTGAHLVTPSDYWDHTFQLGWNMAAGGGRVITTEPAWGLQWESKFWSASAFGAEFHLKMIAMSGVEFRPLTFWCAHDATEIQMSNTITNWTIKNPADGSLQAQLIIPSTGLATWNMSNVGFNFNFNNSPVAHQMNAAAGGFIPLPYYDNHDILQMQGPIQINGGISSYTNAFIFSAVAMADSGTAWMLNGGAVTGQVWGFRHYLDATGQASNLIANQNSTSSTADALLHVISGGPSGGDPFAKFEVTGGYAWSIGCDNSDGDKFKIAFGGGLDTQNALTFDYNGGSGVADFVYLPKPPRFTVAGLPSAATAGAGACAIATDLSGSTYAYGAAAAGGGSRVGKVFSTGSAWLEG